MYARIMRLEMKVLRLFDKANALMRKHAEDPQRRLPLGDDR